MFLVLAFWEPGARHFRRRRKHQVKVVLHLTIAHEAGIAVQVFLWHTEIGVGMLRPDHGPQHSLGSDTRNPVTSADDRRGFKGLDVEGASHEAAPTRASLTAPMVTTLATARPPRT